MRVRSWILFRPLIPAMAVLFAVAFTSAARADEERWYVVQFMGSRAGWLRMAEIEVEDGNLRTETEMRLEIKRGLTVISVALSTSFLETAQGEPVRMESVMDMGGVTRTKFEFLDDGRIRVRTATATGSHERFEPAPQKEWLTPGQAGERVGAYLEEGDEEFSIATMDPSAGASVITTRYRVIESTKVEALGKTVPAMKWEVTQDYMPGVTSVEFVDEDGELLRSEQAVGGMKLTILASDKELATSNLEPAEIMASTLVRPNRSIKNPRQTQRAVYIIDAGDGLEIPTAGAQHAQRLGDNRWRVTIDLEKVATADKETAAESAYRTPSSMIDSEDAQIIKLTDRALRSAGESPAERAEAIRRFVHRHINSKNLGVGFASASQVCRTGEGDCTEHAVLTAAMLRAAGIPSRTVSGLIYVDQFLGENNIFGYHMWTQALLEEDGTTRWVDLDATLGDETPYDAAHIALDISSLADGEIVNSMAGLAPALGNLRVQVKSIEHGVPAMR